MTFFLFLYLSIGFLSTDAGPNTHFLCERGKRALVGHTVLDVFIYHDFSPHSRGSERVCTLRYKSLTA